MAHKLDPDLPNPRTAPSAPSQQCRPITKPQLSPSPTSPHQPWQHTQNRVLTPKVHQGPNRTRFPPHPFSVSM